MRTIQQIYRELQPTDLQHIDSRLHRKDEYGAVKFVERRLGVGPVMAKALVDMRLEAF